MQVGRILLDGKPLKDLERKERAKQIAILPQSRAIPSLPAKTLVEHGRFSYQGFLRRKNREDEAAVEESMRFTNTLQYQWENVEELSGGERQRVFFARTLSQDSRIIILDEPTTFMDISYQSEFLQLVRKLKDRGKTILLILHNLTQALDISDRIAVMEKGRAVFYGTSEQCMASGILQQVFHVACKVFEDSGRIYPFFE